MTGALAGIRVADFSEYIAGPYCTMMLADMGADVVKVERPEGDAWRHTVPVAAYESRGFLGVNRGKRSIALDLERPEGVDIARRLALGADAVVISYRPGVSQRLGLDYETLEKEKAALVYCENTAFGQKGPYAGRPGFDILSQAATGMVLYENKLERGVPTFIGTLAVADLTTGMFMAFAIVSALYARTVSGKGQRIETSLFASGLAAQYRPLLSVEEVDRSVREGFLAELAARRKTGLRYEGADFRNYTYAKYGREILSQPHQAAFQVFDAKVENLLRDEYRIAQVTKASAQSMGELADKLGIDRAGLERTVEAFNAAVQPGEFDPTRLDGKGTEGIAPPKSNWALPLDTPPYSGYAVTCGITFTFGGLRIDREARVLNTAGRPIPGLYAAGELVGGLFWGNYAGGSGLMAGSVFGRVAGRSAARHALAAGVSG